jgi:hypothetical protein
MNSRSNSDPRIDLTNYDLKLNRYNSLIQVSCSKDISRMLNSDGTIDRRGFVVDLDLLSDDIEDIKKKLHLLTYVRRRGEI